MFVYDRAGKMTEEMRYHHGEKHGRQVTKEDDYRVSQEYVNGKRQGEYTKTYPNGQLAARGAYDENGKKTGRWESWRENGTLLAEEHYLDDELDGEKRVYYAGEKLKSLETYAAGDLHGPKVDYDEDPHRVSREVTYADGKMHGPFKVYHDGILWREGAYQDGKLIYEKEFAAGKLQIVKGLDETGSLVEVEKYDNTGRRTYRNTHYRRHSSVTLKESPSGVFDVEIQ